MKVHHPPHLPCFLCLDNIRSDSFASPNPGSLKAPIQSFPKRTFHAFLFSPLFLSFSIHCQYSHYSRKNCNLHVTIFLTESMSVDRTFVFMGDAILFILEGMTDDLWPVTLLTLTPVIGQLIKFSVGNSHRGQIVKWLEDNMKQRDLFCLFVLAILSRRHGERVGCKERGFVRCVWDDGYEEEN